ncbi:50S ribosomal protein L25/general stress protein Ctc [Labedella endophytica]|uniref:Large ribosomal subunit protein bL25 n=1 Tax=Labedella endophytica TaxID=1523160 RepID=A0A433JQB2_9MICO|nr:50S ribosomal protein L25/general stress protein Ctc [Labedella endophytica]RUQ99170.1 50S ribosomal protein L25/general stress protein Ctc [Labedella endophytica]
MSDDNKVTTEIRESFGKGAARKIRAAGKIPAVIYGHGTEPQHVTLPGHQMLLIVRKANQIITLDIAGEEQLVLVKDVQRDPVLSIIEHIDLIVVRKGEKVTVDVPVVLEGDSYPGTIANLDASSISLEVEATHIPERVTVSIEGLEDGSQISAAELTLPAGASLLSDPETLIVGITTPPAPTDDDLAADEAAAEAGAEAGVDSDEDADSK